MLPSGPTAGGRSTCWPPSGTRHLTSPPAAQAEAGHAARTPRTIRKSVSLRICDGRFPAIACGRNETLVLGPRQPHLQLLAGELHLAALRANRQARDGRSQVAQILAEEDRRGCGGDGPQCQLGAAHLEANLLEPSVAERA